MMTHINWAGGLTARCHCVQYGGVLQRRTEFYNWVDYTPPELIEKFERETGIKVNVDTYDSNETLLAKLKSGAAGYDRRCTQPKFRHHHGRRRHAGKNRCQKYAQLQKCR